MGASPLTACYVSTFGGSAMLDLCNPEPDAVDPEQLGITLARLARWGGKTRRDFGAYSVAQHSYNVALLVTPDLKLPALLHDAHEAILGADICAPIRHRINLETDLIERLCEEWDAAIATRFGFDPDLFYHVDIKRADMEARKDEEHWLMDESASVGQIPYRFRPQGEREAFTFWMHELCLQKSWARMV